MTDEIFDADKRRVAALQMHVVRSGEFFLAGGTGLGLRLGHRQSRDLDWFTPRDFDAAALERTLAELPEQPTLTKRQGQHTLRAYYGNLETSFLFYNQVPAHPELLTVGGLQVPTADLQTLALMKAAAVHDRGTKRDFIDIHAICTRPGWSVGRFIDLATSKLPLQPVQMKLALGYFADAEREEMPRGFLVPWNTVKADLQRGVRDWERNRPRGLDR